MNKNIKKILAVALVSASFSTMAVMPAFAASQYVQVTGNPVAVRENAGTSFRHFCGGGLLRKL